MNPDVVNSVAGFLGISEEELLERHDDYLRHQLARWHQMAPADAKDLAAYYDDNLYLYELISTPSAGLVRLVAPFLPAKASILDFGSGIGTHGIHFVERGHRVTFVDLPSPHFDYLRWRLQKVGADARLVERSAAAELEARSFDAILCFDVLEHVVDWRETTELLARLLKPGGKLFFVVSFREFEEHAIHIASQTGLDERSFDALLAGLGLHEVFRRDHPVPLTHPLEPFRVFAGTAGDIPTGASKLFRQGTEAFAHGAFDTAERCFAELVKWNPEDFAAHRELARVSLARGRAEEAEARVAKALDLLADDVMAIELSADIAAQAGNALEAARRYAKAVMGWPDRADHSRRNLASLVDDEASFRAVLDIAKGWRDRQALASFLIGCRLFGRAEAVLAPALAEHRQDTYAGYLLWKEHARLLRDTGRAGEAADVLRRLCQIHPERLWLHFDLALCHSALGDHRTALDELDREEVLSPFRSAVQFEKGLLWRQIGDIERAAEAFGTAARLMPEFGAAFLEHARTLAELGRFDEARDAGCAAVTLLPDDENALLLLARARRASGDLENARIDLGKCVRMRPQRADAWFELAEIEVLTGRRISALRSFNAAYKIAPDDVWPRLGFGTKLVLAILGLPARFMARRSPAVGA